MVAKTAKEPSIDYGPRTRGEPPGGLRRYAGT